MRLCHLDISLISIEHSYVAGLKRRGMRGERYVHGNVELVEKLGRNDLCPCGSDLRFQAVLPKVQAL
ncbi:MAG: hypothetical protein GY877_12950 [Hyphomicrobium sp.]|nr:hypothetical protein [Hyphomicrobium sp.]